MLVALVGNQNSGKTTLFNSLTGLRCHAGNFPGVTVEQRSSRIIGCDNFYAVDLPGVYSLSPLTEDEVLTRDFLLSRESDLIVNVIDASNLERNLYLSLQLAELGTPMVMVFNMMDELAESGNTIDINLMEKFFRVRIFPVFGSFSGNVSELVEFIVSSVDAEPPNTLEFYNGAAGRTMASVAGLISAEAAEASIPTGFAAARIIEGDYSLLGRLGLSDNQKKRLGSIVSEFEKDEGVGGDEALACMRYAYIKTICDFAVKKTDGVGRFAKRSISRAADRILTDEYLGIPIFLMIMFAVFMLSFNIIGPRLGKMVEYAADTFSVGVCDFMSRLSVSPLLYSLVSDGILRGAVSVLEFLPVVIVLSVLLSLLEDSGYMARAAFILDGFMRKIGLSGRMFVPMLVGFGCSVPAIMATRTLPSRRDRVIAVFLIPFMSCGAKLTVYSFFASVFFPGVEPFVITLLYVIGILVGIAAAFLSDRFLAHCGESAFIIELPPYRLPSLKSVFVFAAERSAEFISKVFTVVLCTSVVIWFSHTFDFRLSIACSASESMLGVVGNILAPLFSSLGFGDGRFAVSLIAGFGGKEAVAGTLGVMFDSVANMRSVISPAGAFCFLVFILLYTPCVSAVAAARKELGSLRLTLLFVIFQNFTAYAVSYGVYSVIDFFVR